MSTYVGPPPTFVVDSELPAATLNAHLRDFIASFGAWNAYVPTITQGTSTDVAKTITYAKYIQRYKSVEVTVLLSVTGSGQAGQPITVTYPVAPAFTGSSLITFGTGIVRDGSVEYVANVGSSTTAGGSAVFRRADANSTGQVGEDPNFALASGDIIGFHVSYEAA